MHDVFCPIAGDLARVRERVDRYTQTGAGDLKEYAYLEECGESYIHPALVLFAARIGGQVTDNTIYLAEIFQLIYLASTIHRDISEDVLLKGNNSPDPRDGYQYPVLVGDYLYSRAFLTLIETGNMKYMTGLTELICRINEGGILRNKNQASVVKTEVWRETVRLEKAELMAGCCLMGAQSAGADSDCRNNLRRFGYSLGMAIGMSEIKRCDQAAVFYNDALSHLDRLPPVVGRNDLKNMVMFLMDKHIDSNKMVC